MNRFLIVLMLASTATLVGADTVPQWGRWEQAFTGREGAAPKTDLIVDFMSPSGKVRSVLGFWDGGATWRERFSPDETGGWKYRTHSVPVVPGLDGQAGQFQCDGSAGARSPFLRHGSVRVSTDGRHFEHADGTPFFWLGDTVWYGAILSMAPDWETYLNDRERKGFSVVHFNVVAPRNGVAADENGEVSFTGLENIRMNPKFYQHLDERVEAVNAHGMLAALVQTWGLRKQDSGNYLPESQLICLMRYLEARYGANHVVWILTGDAHYEGEQGERFKRAGRTVFGGRPHAPTTLHPAGMLFPFEAFREEKWLDFLIYQSGHGDDARTLEWIHSGPVSSFWQKAPARPADQSGTALRGTPRVSVTQAAYGLRNTPRDLLEPFECPHRGRHLRSAWGLELAYQARRAAHGPSHDGRGQNLAGSASISRQHADEVSRRDVPIDRVVGTRA
jgi:hypothetical protein